MDVAVEQLTDRDLRIYIDAYSPWDQRRGNPEWPNIAAFLYRQATKHDVHVPDWLEDDVHRYLDGETEDE